MRGFRVACLMVVASLVFGGCGGGGPPAGGGGTSGAQSWTCDEQSTTTLTVDVGSVTASVLKHGFVNGILDPNVDTPHVPYGAAAALNAKSWRLADPWHAAFLAPMGPQLTYVLMDGFQNYNPAVMPWEPDFSAWEAYVAKVVQTNKDNGIPIAFFDIWGEPPVDTATAPLVLETYRRAYAIIRATDPAAKIVAPSTAWFAPAFLASFLDDAVAHGITYDALSWHSFGSPADIIADADAARALIAARPTLGPMELHVNEYMSEKQHLVPGFNVAWLAALEASGVDVADRACWDAQYDDQGVYGDCWQGLEGVYMRDGITPQASFWVLEPYGRLSTTRYAAASSTTDVALLAGRDATSSELVVLIGYAGAPSRLGTHIVLTVKGAPPIATVPVAIDRVPSPDDALHAVPLIAPLRGPEPNATPVASTVTVDLGCVPTGAAMVVRLAL